jgi:intracellular sulfur oxidation DsrE/DsrF family protein
MPYLKRSACLWLALLAWAACLAAPAAAEPPYPPQKVVYHFNTNSPQVNGAGLKNIQNHINALGKENLTVVALVHSAAWEMVAKERAVPLQVERMKALIAQGVVFKMCQNTLNEFKLDLQKDLAIPMTVVPAGVAELVKLQQEGYAYIKP